MKKIVLCSDHAGFELKNQIKDYLKNSCEVFDVGAEVFVKEDSYVEFAKKANDKIASNQCEYGIYVCGSGVGMAIVANRQKGIRAVNAHSEDEIKLARNHNNANVLCLGANHIDFEKAKHLIDVFLTENFDGGRHQKRVEDIDK